MEITKTERLLYFDQWVFQPKYAQLAFKYFRRFRGQMPPAADDKMEMSP